MSHWMDETEDLVPRGRIKVPYRWWVGRPVPAFLWLCGTREDPGHLLQEVRQGVRAAPENLRPVLSRAHGVAGGGPGRNARHVHRCPIHGADPPHGRSVRLRNRPPDGADTGLAHLVAEYREGELRSGLRVEAVFREERKGDILDICYFRPARSAA